MQSTTIAPAFWISMLVVVASNVVYHLAQKTIPQDAHPVASVLVSYLTATIGTLLLIPFFPAPTSWRGAFAGLNWSSALVGLSIVGVEFGFLLAYRAGWQVNIASLTAGATLALLLVPLGALLFREGWSWQKTAGLVLCLLGLVLLNRK